MSSSAEKITDVHTRIGRIKTMMIVSCFNVRMGTVSELTRSLLYRVAFGYSWAQRYSTSSALTFPYYCRFSSFFPF